MERKNIPVLRFPEFDGEWVKDKLGNVSKFLKGKGVSKGDVVADGEYECIRYGELYTLYGETIDEVYSKTSQNSDQLFFSKANDVIIPSSGETQLDIAKASCVLKSGIALGGDINVIRTPNNGVFLSYYLNSTKRKDIARIAQGISVIHLYSSQLASLMLNLPTLPEQKKIATFFTAIDQKISQLKKKHQLLEQYKKGVMQQIFSQQIRFKDEDGREFPKWEKKRLGDVFREYKENSIVNNQHEVLTSSNKGLLLQKDYYGDNRLTERDNKGFNVIPDGFITYRSRSDNGIFTFNLNNLGITGIISTYYPVFDATGGENKFFVEYLNYIWRLISVLSVGTSQKVFPFSAFTKINIPIPPKNEQTKIANFLSALDDKIQHTQKQIEQAEQWKKGLMQKMFV